MGEHSGYSTDDDVEVDEGQESDSDLGMVWFTWIKLLKLLIASICSDIECLLHEVVSVDGDYQPFPSKIFSLLFALLHSPRPMVFACIIYGVS